MSQHLNPSLNSASILSFPSSDHIDQVRMIVTHPFFTGCCPHCKQKLSLVERTPGQCQCSRCGWSDRDGETEQ